MAGKKFKANLKNSRTTSKNLLKKSKRDVIVVTVQKGSILSWK